MKIGFVIANYYNMAGTERVTAAIANGLAQRGHDISIISCENGEREGFQLEKQIRLFNLGIDKFKNSYLKKIELSKRVYKLQKKEQFDILIAVDIYIFLFMVHLKWLTKVKLISWEHFSFNSGYGRSRKIARKLAVKYGDAIIVLSNDDLQKYNHVYGNNRKISHIYNPLTFSLHPKSDLMSKRIIAIGRLATEKGFGKLIEAWSSIEDRIPEWKLDIFGEGPLHSELQNLIENLKLKNVSLKGYSKNVDIELLDSSLLVCSSKFEGFSLVLTEAMSKGVPCIAFSSPGPREIINSGKNGFIIKNGDITGLSNAILELTTNRDKLIEFGNNASSDLHKFSLEFILDKWEDLLNNFAN